MRNRLGEKKWKRKRSGEARVKEDVSQEVEHDR